ncbi:lipopolysaccharide heptosyltransferase I [Helicobacter winghamensis]|uniref:Lipopolysaccharide heptosyltransferase 1 n=1 Tax=Helicobacter winghamensis TaxID=157268 RepID=A0A2N3PIT1_9HELI|nr:lipopolysaccharide heptosyltransferase I [Helicobacter winghamensis]EEO25226.1 lipopolysaccharide heptosyltransferase I [Helicobacter winghamensis ATCC BAA-430]PKT76404.1 lipopolysaccharide heptosyltransferase I [Helicobacter winghamensis]PKT80784.1 lipopolysaccharide heptosyltransferase I [Helicobacter winghamensis]PKT81199.1 lipopolysaccharide heptosyltransferase I [Helicobacter winghamensis]QOQ98443.1 lipopolysaccharide heptosyltransferase I [Helicobacter winghamensis]
MPKNLNLAIVRLSAMGDIIHSASILPSLLETLKTHYTINLSWILDSNFKEILDDSPYIHQLIALPLKEAIQSKNPKALFAIYKTLKTKTFDMVLDMQGLLKSALIAKSLNTESIFGFQSPKEPLTKLFYTKKIPIPYSSHILLRNATLAFGAFDLEIPSLESLKQCKSFLGFAPMDFPFLQKDKNILCVLETSKPNKTYPLEKFLELAKLLNAKGYTPIFLSKNPIIIPNTANFYHAHSLGLKQIKSLVAQMDLVIGGDTGITHLAWALQRPSITLFGATPQERFNLNTEQNLSLSANANASYKKDDFSIKTLAPTAILELTEKLLDRKM